MKAWPKVALGDLFQVEKGRVGIMAATPGDFPLVTTGEEFASHIEPHFSGDAVCIPLISATGHGHASLKRLHPGGHPNSSGCGHPKLPHLMRPDHG
jgi:type I restriction enzyme S subunit